MANKGLKKQFLGMFTAIVSVPDCQYYPQKGGVQDVR